MQGHLKAEKWRMKTIDFKRLSLAFGADIVIGQFSRTSI